LEFQNKVSYKSKINNKSLLDKGVRHILLTVDYQYGGVGRAPKFHHAKVWEFLLYKYFFTKDRNLLKVIELSLDAMAKGGVYDHLLGGFFRYSTNERWIVPHFEKMLYDNAENFYSFIALLIQIIPKELY